MKFARSCLTSSTVPTPSLQIDFESRLGAHDVGNDCLMKIDGTDFRINQKGPAARGNAFASYKYAGKSALRYKLVVDILAGNLFGSLNPTPWVSTPTCYFQRRSRPLS